MDREHAQRRRTGRLRRAPHDLAGVGGGGDRDDLVRRPPARPKDRETSMPGTRPVELDVALGSLEQARCSAGDRARASVRDRRRGTRVGTRHRDADPSPTAGARPAVPGARGHRVEQPGVPERGREPEVDEPGTADVDPRQPAVAIPDPPHDERGDGLGRLAQLARQHQGDVAGEVPERGMPGGVHPEPGHRAIGE